MNKAFGVFVLLVVGGLAFAFFRGGVASYDPDARGAEVKAAIKPGMTWSQVLDVEEPGKYQTVIKTKKRVGGETIEMEELGAVLEFNRDLFEKDIAARQMPDGFAFNYFFTQQIAFKVVFDASGKVALVENNKTMADLLQTRND